METDNLLNIIFAINSQDNEDINKKCLENDIIFVPTTNKRAPFAGFN